jgi:hypothetical protein
MHSNTALHRHSVTAMQVQGSTAMQVQGSTAMQVEGSTAMQVGGSTALLATDSGDLETSAKLGYTQTLQILQAVTTYIVKARKTPSNHKPQATQNHKTCTSITPTTFTLHLARCALQTLQNSVTLLSPAIDTKLPADASFVHAAKPLEVNNHTNLSQQAEHQIAHC